MNIILFTANTVGIYLFKVNNGNTRIMPEICSSLTIKTPGRRQWRRSIFLSCLRVTQKLCNYLSICVCAQHKEFCNSHSCSFLPLLSRRSWTDWHKFFFVINHYITQSVCDQGRTYYYDMPRTFVPCILEINSNGRFKWEHVEILPSNH